MKTGTFEQSISLTTISVRSSSPNLSGFYLSWGDCVWLPFMYTLQSHYLVRNPIDLTLPYLLLVCIIGHAGYYVFRATNYQKDIVRRTKGDCKIWGSPAKFIKTGLIYLLIVSEYETSDGEKHSSILLLSGFWGVSRHFNYVGDLLISLAMCMTCGGDHLLPYFYIIYMIILLLTRINRDHDRCMGKYGKYWEQYCKEVPYALIPYVY
jgi:7-dehydrocholesterol reductase